MDLSFTQLLNDDLYDVNDGTPSQSLPPLSESQEHTQDYKTKSKKGRSKNFSIQEDMLLIFAWQNVSSDPIQGNNQTQQTYWSRVMNYFNEHRSFTSDRTQNALCNRWSTIQLCVSKFQGYYNQIEGRNESGVCEQDKAMEMYQSLQHSTFSFMHCWTELRNSLKFTSNLSKKKCKPSQHDNPVSSPSIQSPININQEEKSEEGLELPIRRKAAKKMKRMAKESNNDEFTTILNQMKEHVTVTVVARNKAFENLVKMEEERHERERLQLQIIKAKEERENQIYEASILALDTSTMESQLASYYNSLKNKILEKIL